MRAEPYVTPDTLPVRTAAWLEQVRGAVAPRPWLRLDPSRCALLVVDMNRYFAHPDGASYLPASAAVLPRILSLLGAWRELGAPVAFTRHGHRGPGDAGMLGRFYRGWIRADQPEAELLPELSPREGEAVFPKTTYDAFLGTGLESWLQARGVDQVLITGVLTQMCCETSARAAFTRGFEVYLPADGTATTHEATHLCSLTGLAGAVAVVMSTEEVLATCARS
ncbi:MAG: cysteine hydrolase [Deltaproteobacteria bacterium]|nr:cysteine hydrolase [Deltaproteobacteria bacterium]